ncbi:MAG: uridine kinase [Blautia massiliensis (ex Durand et al. 2017)]|nr:MAG: uridine kinase [Subdoligranulum variabile]
MSAAVFPGAQDVLAAARRLAQGDAPVLLAIDGRCGSGKSTLAAWLAEQVPCHLVHMDDFYLPLAARRPDWTEHPGANMDFARLRAEVLDPLLAGQAAAYRAYVCRLGQLQPAVPLGPRPLTIVEGSYALHPALGAPYACRVFLTCTPDCQRARLQKREGAHYPAFESRWIPLEEGYLAAVHPEQGCDFVLDTTAASVV